MAETPCPTRFARDVVVIGGCGHVGLPLAIAFALRGLRVGIFDLSESAVACVNSATMPFAEPVAMRFGWEPNPVRNPYSTLCRRGSR